MQQQQKKEEEIAAFGKSELSILPETHNVFRARGGMLVNILLIANFGYWRLALLYGVFISNIP